MNIYCFSTLSFAKLQFKSVINKAFHKHGVASFTDAWIETLIKRSIDTGKPSHLLQMRGLKQLNVGNYTEASESHLLQMRGLKPVGYNHIVPNITSHLLQMRGLKPVYIFSPRIPLRVASFTDAWIETLIIYTANA